MRSVTARAQLLQAAVGDVHRHRPPARARGHQRVEGVGGPRREQLVALAEQHERRGLQQLGRAVAHRDPLRLHVVQPGQRPAHVLRVAVRVAVHAPARGVDRGVHHLGVGELRPLGAGQVQVGHLLQRQRALAVAALAALLVQLALVDVLELPVVVEQAHGAGVLVRAARARGPVPR